MTLTTVMGDAEALVAQGRWAEALGVLGYASSPSQQQQKSAMARKVDDLRVVPLACECMARLGRHREALDVLDANLSRRKGWAAGWVAKAKILFDIGKVRANITTNIPREKTLPCDAWRQRPPFPLETSPAARRFRSARARLPKSRPALSVIACVASLLLFG